MKQRKITAILAGPLSSVAEGNAYSAREAGYANPWRAAQADPRRKRLYEARFNEACKLVVRAFTGSKRDLLNLQEALSLSRTSRNSLET